MHNLIFSHISDIDGMGSVVLLKLVEQDLHYELCETFNVNDKFEEYYNSKKIYDYDYIYITDLCLDDEHLKIIQNDSILKSKVKIFDHHESVLQFNSYDFVNIVIKDKKGFCCGTTLFYKYLLDNKIIKSNQTIDKFCELTRRHDTWEWKKIYNDEMSRNFSLLFETVGTEKYIEIMYNKLKTEIEFKFNDVEEFLIENRKTKMMENVLSYVQDIVYKEIFGLKAGIVFISYEYRNEVAQYLTDMKYDIDFVMLIAIEHGTISYRSVKPGVNVRIVAEKMGGKGHDEAAGNSISNIQKEQILDILLS